MDYETIEYETVEKGIGMLSLNRPRRYNAVSYQMMIELEHFWREKQNDLDTHVLILRGNGNKGFCSGLDMAEAIKKFKDMDPDTFYAFQSRLARLNLAMRRVPQPIICDISATEIESL